MNFIDIDKSLFALMNGSSSELLDNIMIAITTWWVWLPLYVVLAILIIRNNENKQSMMLPILFALCCFACTEILSDVIAKPIFQRLRPCNDPSIEVQVVEGYRYLNYGFFSSHAANTMGLCVFISLLVKDKVMSVTMFVYSLCSSWSRIYLAQHFPSDVVVGLLVGAGIGWLLYQWYIIMSVGMCRKMRYVSDDLTVTGYSRSDVRMVCSLVVMILICIIIYSVIASG